MKLTEAILRYGNRNTTPAVPASNKHDIWIIANVVLEQEPWQLYMSGKYTYVSGDDFTRIWNYSDYGLKYNTSTSKWYLYLLSDPSTVLLECNTAEQEDPVGGTWTGSGTTLNWDGTPPYCAIRVTNAGTTDTLGDYPLISVDESGGFYWKKGYCVLSGSSGYYGLCIDGGGCWYSGEGSDPTVATWTATNGSEPVPTCSWIQ